MNCGCLYYGEKVSLHQGAGGGFVIKLWKGVAEARQSCSKKTIYVQENMMKHGIWQQENSLTLIHFICTISRSAAANISVLASPRMIPICIVAPPPWDSIQQLLHRE